MKWQCFENQKLIPFLQGHLTKEYSGKFLRKALEKNCCKVNGVIERFGSRRIFKGDLIELVSSWEERKRSQYSFETLFENKDLLIVNKPPFWVSSKESLKKSFSASLQLVHRLDKETTGAFILAKTSLVKEKLISLFREKKIDKSYLALVGGKVARKEGKIRSFLTKKGHFQGQSIWGSSSEGAEAITYFRTLKTTSSASLLLCKPITGRTHQIRVHLSEMDHPILTDRQYAEHFHCSTTFARAMLHAEGLRFVLDSEKIEIKAPLFPDMKKALSALDLLDAYEK